MTHGQDHRRPLIVHVVHRFDVGGMENGVVNLVNNLPPGFCDHCVVALTEVAPGFAERLTRKGVKLIGLHKAPGPNYRLLPRAWRLFRSLRPAIVHTRNVATLELQAAAFLAGVPVRLHGEHGWDIGDLDGSNRKMQRLRRALRPLVHCQVALSSATERYLLESVGVPRTRVVNICNGVDTARFAPGDPAEDACREVLPPHWPRGAFVVGALGRLAAVKNFAMLLRAFGDVCRRNREFAAQARLLLIGDGPEEIALRSLAEQSGVADAVWFAGARPDVARCLRAIDLVAVPSLAEGISNAILESMATGLPVVATRVGGNPELVADGVTGMLLDTADEAALADAIETYFTKPELRRVHGQAGRVRAVTEFSLAGMVEAYHRLYATLLDRRGIAAGSAANEAALSRHSW